MKEIEDKNTENPVAGGSILRRSLFRLFPLLLAFTGAIVAVAGVAWAARHATSSASQDAAETGVELEPLAASAAEADEDMLYTVTISITYRNGNTESYDVHTGAETVSGALSDASAINLSFGIGADPISGLPCVTSVNGSEASGDAYWICAVGGIYAEDISKAAVTDGCVISVRWTEFDG